MTTVLDVEAPCVTCEGEGAVDCADDRRVEKCTDPRCKRHLHICTNCHGSGLAKDQCYGPGIDPPVRRIRPRTSEWDDVPY